MVCESGLQGTVPEEQKGPCHGGPVTLTSHLCPPGVGAQILADIFADSHKYRSHRSQVSDTRRTILQCPRKAVPLARRVPAAPFPRPCDRLERGPPMEDPFQPGTWGLLAKCLTSFSGIRLPMGPHWPLASHSSANPSNAERYSSWFMPRDLRTLHHSLIRKMRGQRTVAPALRISLGLFVSPFLRNSMTAVSRSSRAVPGSSASLRVSSPCEAQSKAGTSPWPSDGCTFPRMIEEGRSQRGLGLHPPEICPRFGRHGAS